MWLGSSLPASAQRPFSVSPPDAPELAARGKFTVGVRTIEVVLNDRPDILHFDPKSGKAPLYKRSLPVEIWYPATIPSGQKEATTYTSAMPGRERSADSATFSIPGQALRDAPAVTGTPFPLVIVSHGYPGSRTFLTYLTENIASKGYIVAAIDHTDSVFGHVDGFPSTLLNRSNDQLSVMGALLAGNEPNGIWRSLIDPNRVAVIGYSMGGYGALITAGAGVSRTSPLQKAVPGNYLEPWTEGNEQFNAVDRHAIKAIVAIAPWGNQPPYSAWSAGGLANIHIPSLFIAGDQDDVADFAHGIQPAFESAINSQRYLLIYQNARHNTGGNPPPAGVPLSYSLLQSFDEPVWRKDRITSINQHFITAFLDLYLKGDESRRAFLDVSPANSNDGVWKLRQGARDEGGFSTGTDADGHTFWTGFQRRWALGLRLIHEQPK